MDKIKVLVLGIDGGTWNLIDLLVKAGKLPTIANLIHNGFRADLESSIPHVTFPAWKCYSTGKNPGKLGCYWFLRPDITKQKLVLNSSTSFKGKELWDYLGESGISCGVVDMPTTYPPKKIKEFMISNGAPRLSGYTYPEDLERELKDNFDYQLDPYSFEVDKDRYLLDIENIIKQRFNVAGYLLKKFKPSFFHMTVFHIDGVQHFFWKFMEESHIKYGKVIEDFWILIDSEIKLLMDEFCDEETHTILMSDHGFTAVKCTFQISKWLTEKKYLILRNQRLPLLDLLTKIGLNRERVLFLIKNLRIYSLLRSVMPKEITTNIFNLLFPPGADRAIKNPLEGLINWDKSKVIPTPQGLLYINKNRFKLKEEKEKFEEEIIKEIREIKCPETGEKLAKGVYKANDIYVGECMDYAPDIIILPNEGYEIGASARGRKMWDCSRQQWSGTHKLLGIFLAHGPDIKKGEKMNEIKIYDIAPTILHLFGVPIPSDMDGKVLKEMFEKDSKFAKKEILYQGIEKQTIKEKIKRLKNRNLGKL